MSDENGNGTELMQTSAPGGIQKTEVIQKSKIISDKARSRVEELIDDQTKDLKGYLGNLKSHATAAVQELPFTHHAEVEKLNQDKAVIQNASEKIGVEKAEKLGAVKRILEKQFKDKLARLERLTAQIRRRWEEAQNSANNEVEVEFKDKQADLARQIAEIDTKVVSLQRRHKAEMIMRQAALDHTFSKLEVEISDKRNSAVRKLWTDVETTKDAGGALDMLPDAQTFREHVTPELFLGVFNEFVAGNVLPEKMECKYCGSANLTPDRTYGHMVCASCGKRDVVDIKMAVEPLQLPSLTAILNKSKEKTAPTPVNRMLADQSVPTA